MTERPHRKFQDSVAGDSPLARVLALKQGLARLEVVQPQRAAQLIGVRPRTIYRLLASGELEKVRRSGRMFVSVRSIEQYLEEVAYSPTPTFNLLDEIQRRE